ncbi:MAG: amidase [Okeania sp. SIO3C4]|nr:amidase [Okeania sp. SIO3C4]
MPWLVRLFVLVGMLATCALSGGQAQHASQDGQALSEAEIAFLPAHQLAERIADGRLTSTKLVDIYLARIARFNPDLNAIVTLDAEGARARAMEADAAIQNGVLWGPLHGVPITIKDNYAVANMRATAGYAPYAEMVPQEDAEIVRRLREAGAIILGKTNMPALGLDNQTYNSIFGLTRNPWDPERTAGGSSGGDAVAVAVGFTALSPVVHRV